MARTMSDNDQPEIPPAPNDGGNTENSPAMTAANEEAAPVAPAEKTPRRRLPFQIFLLLWGVALAICAAVASYLFAEYDGANSGGYFVIVTLYAMVGAAALSDAAFRKIPNRFSYAALISALALNLAIAPLCEAWNWREVSAWIGANTGQWGVAGESLTGFGLCVAVGVVSFAARGLGGGDVKIIAALGALAGWSLSISILLNTLLVALVVGIINIAFRGALFQNLQILLGRIIHLIWLRDFSSPLKFKNSESPFCLSLLIAIILLPYVNLYAWLREALP